MELAAKYAYTVYQTGNFSIAAGALHISQPALSAMIAKLENKLGFKLFDRSKSPIEPTVKGKIYIDMLEEIMESEANMARRIDDLTPKKTNGVSVGSSAFLTPLFFPAACRGFAEKYPGIKVRLNSGAKISTHLLSEQLKRKALDFIIAYHVDDEAARSRTLFEERNLVAARRDLEGIDKLMPYALTRGEALRGGNIKTVPKDQLMLFDDVKFITTDNRTAYRNRLSSLLDGHFSVSDFSVRNILNYGLNYDMMRAGLGATVARSLDLCDPSFEDDAIVYFAFEEANKDRGLKVFWRGGEELSAPALELIDLISRQIRLLIDKVK